ncbi:zinc-binding dehydrogenase [Streptomyces sp. NPDC087300]|uniref:zinc-binding dehydrogenase n=1 Tax=Streptomyces sp. NPDC087300 TaxID=3365780 RepID=UPI0038005A09
MKAIAIKAYGDPEGLAVVDLPAPAPAAGQVLVATEAVGVGGVDTVIRSGALAGLGFTEGHVIGSEVAGRVTAVGDGVDRGWIGRRVWAFTGRGGGYVEQAVAKVQDITPLPEGLSAIDAVTLGSAGTVAHFGLAHAHPAPGESVLVRGAAGSIGLMAVQLAAARGAGAVAVTTSSAERAERLRLLGATHVLDRSGDGGDDAPDAPDGYDVILDVVGGPGMPSFIDRLRPNGRMIGVGVIAGWPPADFGARLLAAFGKSLTFGYFSADSISATDLDTVRSEQFAAASRGELKTVVHEVLPLDQAVTAHQKMAAGEVFGRIVLTP